MLSIVLGVFKVSVIVSGRSSANRRGTRTVDLIRAQGDLNANDLFTQTLVVAPKAHVNYAIKFL